LCNKFLFYFRVNSDEGVYTDWRTALDWTAFREASFGVAKLVVENATHARYTWNRHACQSDSPGYPNYNMNFSATCVTDGDTAGQAMIVSDETWFVRPSYSSCANRYRSTAEANANNDDTASTSSSSDDSLSSLEVGLAVTTALFGVSTVVLAMMLFGSKSPAPSAGQQLLSSSSTHDVYGGARTL